jgi:hypothetical protein
MKFRLFIASAVLVCCTAWLFAEEEPSESVIEAMPASNETEARARAMMLHEMVRGALQVMHRDFFDEGNARAIPSASLEDVFHEMGKRYDMELKWLIVNTDVVNVDHEAETAFEKAAVKTLAAGKPFAEAITANRYRFAGPIHLRSQCLKCHVKRRISNEDRLAGLVITMPITVPITVESRVNANRPTADGP